jgi:hypothetical protein
VKTSRVLVLAAVGIALVACSTKSVDIGQTRAEMVPGTSNLYRFCDGPTLIYFSKRDSGSDDEYEWFYPGGCTPNPPTSGVPNGDSTDRGEK